MRPSVSIIIPVYNVEKYLTECLDSVLNQTIPFDEIIIVNDGSTDSSEEICLSYKLKNPELVLIKQKNAGLSVARNTGLEIAKGDYIVFLDSDDLISSKMCETIKLVLEKNGFLDVVYYAADFIKEIPIAFPEDGYGRNSEMAGVVLNGFHSLRKLFPEYYQMSVCMSAYRNMFLKNNNIRFIKDILYEDRFFSLRVITEAEAVIYVTDKLYVRRFRADSIVTSPSARKKIEDVIYGHKAEWNYISNNLKWQNCKALTQYYVLCGSYMAFQNNVSSLNEAEERKTYVLTFLNRWLSYFDIHIMTINELTFLVYLLKKIEKDKNMLSMIRDFETENDLYQYESNVKGLLINKCREKLANLPLKDKVRVGIYGIGQHTKCMLNLYQDMLGKIESDLYFIVSQNAGRMEQNVRKIKHIEDLYPDTAYIIVSSKIYQTEMCKKLDQVRFDSKKVVVLYGANDAVDFAIIHEVLETA